MNCLNRLDDLMVLQLIGQQLHALRTERVDELRPQSYAIRAGEQGRSSAGAKHSWKTSSHPRHGFPSRFVSARDTPPSER